MTELYVYYKLRAEQAAEARAAFDAACDGLGAVRPVRLLERSGLPGDALLLTWMEIHAGAADAAESERHLARAMAPFVQGSRHVECFEPLAGRREG